MKLFAMKWEIMIPRRACMTQLGQTVMYYAYYVLSCRGHNGRVRRQWLSEETVSLACQHLGSVFVFSLNDYIFCQRLPIQALRLIPWTKMQYCWYWCLTPTINAQYYIILHFCFSKIFFFHKSVEWNIWCIWCIAWWI